MITRVSGRAAVIWRVASMPSKPGMRTSMSTTSGRSSRAQTIASEPLPASPTTVRPALASSTMRNPIRSSG